MCSDWVRIAGISAVLTEKALVFAAVFVDYLAYVHRVVVSEVTSFLNVSSPQTGCLSERPIRDVRSIWSGISFKGMREC